MNYIFVGYRSGDVTDTEFPEAGVLEPSMSDRRIRFARNES